MFCSGIPCRRLLPRSNMASTVSRAIRQLNGRIGGSQEAALNPWFVAARSIPGQPFAPVPRLPSARIVWPIFRRRELLVEPGEHPVPQVADVGRRLEDVALAPIAYEPGAPSQPEQAHIELLRL